MKLRLLASPAVALAATLAITTASAQPSPWRLVQGPDGVAFVVRGDIKNKIVPAPITEADMLIPEGQVWADGWLADAPVEATEEAAVASEPSAPVAPVGRPVPAPIEQREFTSLVPRPQPLSQPQPAPPAPAPPAPPVAAAPPPAPAPAQPARPVPSAGLTVAGVTTDKGVLANSIYVVGMIENQSAAPVGVRSIAISLLGGNGQTVGGGEAIDKPMVLRPGARAPWRGMISNAPAFEGVRIQPEASSPTDLTFQQVSLDLRLEGVTTHPRRSGAPAKIAGQIVNSGTSTVSLAHVDAGVLSGDGNVIDAQVGFSKLDRLAPGQSAPFEVMFLSDHVRDVPRVELHAEGYIQR